MIDALTKLHKIKRTFQILIALNVFLLVSGLAASAVFFVDYFGTSHDRHRIIEQIHTLDHQSELVIQLLNQKPNTEDQIYIYRKNLEQLSQHPTSKTILQIEEPITNRTQVSQQNLILLNNQLMNEKKAKLDELNNEVRQSVSATALTAIVGILVFIFGILSPIWFIRYAYRKIQDLQREIESKLIKILHEWLRTYSQASDQPFKDPLFWLSTILLAIENFPPRSTHPLVQLIVQYAPIIRTELNKYSEQARAREEAAT